MIQNLNVVFDPSMKDKRDEIEKEARNEYGLDFESMELKKSYHHLFQLLWYSQLPCFDVKNITSKARGERSLLKSCTWKGQSVSCSALFTLVPTDRGMCCSFNKENATNMFEEESYGEQISRMQETDKNGAFEESDLPDWYDEKKEPIPYPGQRNGLRLVLDSHSDMISSGTIGDTFNGFLVLIEEHRNFPLSSRSSFILKPGHENDVTLSASQIYGSQRIRKIEPSNRGCYFSDDSILERFKEYSQSNCILECSLRYAQSHNKNENETQGCTPWFYPPHPDESHQSWCDPWETERFQNLMTSVPDDECSHCLPDCNSTDYDAVVTSAHIRQCDRTNLGTNDLCNFKKDYVYPPMWAKQVKKEYEEATGEVPEYINSHDEKMLNIRKNVDLKEEDPEYNDDDEKPSYDAFEKDIAVANFHFSKPTIMQFQRVESMTWINYLAQIGGLLGLALGISIISGVELIYWITIRLIRNMQSMKESRRYKKEKEYQRRYSAVERHQKVVQVVKSSLTKPNDDK